MHQNLGIVTINYIDFNIFLVNVKVKHAFVIGSMEYFSWNLIFAQNFVIYFFFFKKKKLMFFLYFPLFPSQNFKKKMVVKLQFLKKIALRINFVINVDRYNTNILAALNQVLSLYNTFWNIFINFCVVF